MNVVCKNVEPVDVRCKTCDIDAAQESSVLGKYAGKAESTAEGFTEFLEKYDLNSQYV